MDTTQKDLGSFGSALIPQDANGKARPQTVAHPISDTATGEVNDEGRPENRGTFMYSYCDYDISDMASQVQDQSMLESEQDREEVVVQDERWYDKSSATYFTSRKTRCAQTISLKQRHRPIFQIWLDLQLGIWVTATILLSVIMTIRQDQKATGDNNIDVSQIINGQMTRIIVAAFFYVKFTAFAVWYRNKAEGNVMELSFSVWIARSASDMIIYCILGYIVYMNRENSEGNLVVQEESFVSDWINNEAIAFSSSIILLLVVLVLKEVVVFFTCVRRSFRKIRQEEEMNGTKPVVSKDMGDLDEFIKAQ